MEVLRHFSHVHPLVFNDERNHESGEVFCCACGELVSGPRFSCMECEFHLDKNCAEAPVEMDHHFHRKHNLKLMPISPYVEGTKLEAKSKFNGKSVDLEIKWANMQRGTNMVPKVRTWKAQGLKSK
ncbi:uncharacterized protein LOC108451317 isoform X2 [Gossypium arboreum]|uniref:uncharacterized protein LOC108451317 isoform X2 n=1 Tax=Gossypium arboreum TaxID=29729 RepID=UPI0022F17592|nr:uncharacterized protein LOC108451317 isoform X2 [Gossypium arboreum]